MKEVLVLNDFESIKAVVHPRRIDILNAFKDLPLSAKQLSQILDEPHAKINYHIKSLYKVGILELVEERIKSGIVEKYYYPKSKSIFINKNVINISVENGKEVYLSDFDSIIELLYKDLEEKNRVDYKSIPLTQNEIIELNNTINSKIEEILYKRNLENEELKYDMTIISVLLDKKKMCNS